jgi:hypothetical protein
MFNYIIAGHNITQHKDTIHQFFYIIRETIVTRLCMYVRACVHERRLDFRRTNMKTSK